MKKLMGYLKFLLVLIVVGFALWAIGANYSIIFSKHVVGEVTAVTGGEPDVSAKAFQFVVAIKDRTTGEIYTASSEDRQWTVVQKGQCAEAEFLPYPPWEMTRRGTYFGARLVKLSECH